MSEPSSQAGGKRVMWVVVAILVAVAAFGGGHVAFGHLRDSNRTKFFEAIEVDDVTTVDSILKRYPSLAYSTSPSMRVPGDISIYLSGDSPLGVAVRNQSRRAFDYLMHLNLDVNDSGEAGFPAIGTAVVVDDSYYFSELLARGADPYAVDRYGHDAIHRANRLNKRDLLAEIARTTNAEQDEAGRR